MSDLIMCNNCCSCCDKTMKAFAEICLFFSLNFSFEDKKFLILKSRRWQKYLIINKFSTFRDCFMLQNNTNATPSIKTAKIRIINHHGRGEEKAFFVFRIDNFLIIDSYSFLFCSVFFLLMQWQNHLISPSSSIWLERSSAQKTREEK